MADSCGMTSFVKSGRHSACSSVHLHDKIYSKNNFTDDGNECLPLSAYEALPVCGRAISGARKKVLGLCNQGVSDLLGGVCHEAHQSF